MQSIPGRIALSRLHELLALLQIALLLVLLVPASAWAAGLALDQPGFDRPLGEHARYLTEDRGRLSLEQARAAFDGGHGVDGRSPTLSFGIGSPPVWIHLAVSNPSTADAVRRLSLENTWLDEIEIHFVAADRPVAALRLGDAMPFDSRHHRDRIFSVDHPFGPGTTAVYIRVATPDPIVLPIYLRELEAAAARERNQGYSYGFLYGYLMALLAYNAIIFASLKDRRYLLYTVFMAAFIATNAAYTGHGFQWLWPDEVAVQRRIIPVLMMVFALCGLAFARSFLDTPRNLPAMERVLQGIALLFVAAFALAFVSGDTQLGILLVAFTFVLAFSAMMLTLGIAAVRYKIANATYFLLASLASAVGASITALTVWGTIDFAEWRYRAVEIGMLIDATLLAIALGGQFRAAQLQRLRAEIASKELAGVNRRLNDSLHELERAASTDRLTGLWNRRHFEHFAVAEMERAARYKYPVSLLLFDIDHFKAINDTCGHHTGDEVLKEVAWIVRQCVRDSDSVTRWGGEEFIVLMPSTDLAGAGEAGEKLRLAVASHAFPRGLELTISVGAAEWACATESLDRWVDRADSALYQAKHNGRNRVESATAPAAPTLSDPASANRRLVWHSRYESGHADIDHQHQVLFDDANRVLAVALKAAEAPDAEGDSAALRAAIDTLLADTERHFAEEERLLLQLHWPGLAEHRSEHKRLLARAHELRRDLAENPQRWNATALIDFVSIELVANHLLRFDQGYFPVLHDAHAAAAPHAV